MSNWLCECGTENSAKFCSSCGKKKPEANTNEDVWVCSCGTKNTRKFCLACGNAKPEQATEEKPSDNVLSDGSWICGCGAVNTRKFCSACGSSKESQKAHEEIIDASEGSGFSEDIPEDVPRKAFVSSYKKIAAAILVLVVFIAGGYFGYQKYIFNQYTEKCNEYVAIANEFKNAAVALSEASGDPEDEKRKASLDTFNKDVEKLNKLSDYFMNGNLPEEGKAKRQGWTALTKDTSDFIEKIGQMVSYENMIVGPTHVKHKEEYSGLWTEVKDSAKELKNFAADNDGYIAGQETSEFLAIDDILDNIREYSSNKYDFDKKKVEEDKKKYKEQLQASNSELMKKQEVVFIVNDVQKISEDQLVIKGNFYNNTNDAVAGIQGFLLDLTLKNGDSEVLSIKDSSEAHLQYVPSFIPAKAPSGYMNIFVKANVKDVEFDNFAVNVHKIKWLVKKLVRK